MLLIGTDVVTAARLRRGASDVRREWWRVSRWHRAPPSLHVALRWLVQHGMRAADTDSVVAVEHSVLREEELQNEKSRRERHDESFRPPWRSLAPAQIGELLGALIRRRIERSKLLEVNADGYVLLFRNRLDANLDAFTEVSILPDLREASSIDHVYVIVRGQLVEL